MKRLMSVLILLGFLATLSGCLAAAAGVGAVTGVGAYSYIRGELKATYGVTLDQAWPATLAAVDSLKLNVETQRMDAFGGIIEAKRADGTPVRISLKPLGESSTDIGVRIGTMGNRAKSERIHDSIRQQIGV